MVPASLVDKRCESLKLHKISVNILAKVTWHALSWDGYDGLLYFCAELGLSGLLELGEDHC